MAKVRVCHGERPVVVEITGSSWVGVFQELADVLNQEEYADRYPHAVTTHISDELHDFYTLVAILS